MCVCVGGWVGYDKIIFNSMYLPVSASVSVLVAVSDSSK